MNWNNIRLSIFAFALYPIFYGTWFFYLAFMDIKRNTGLYKSKLGAAWYGLYPLFGIALLMDVLFNWTFGTLYYREFPQEFLFTARSARHIKGTGIQLARAQFVCSYMLDPADRGHCL